jgi:hypothetical protein
MILAGVNIADGTLPKKEDVFRMALNTSEYFNLTNKEEVVNEILDNSGLWEKEKTESEDGILEVAELPLKKNKR